MDENEKLSYHIEQICDLLDRVPKDYEMDRLTQDYLHKLELENLSDTNTLLVASDLRECRRERRKYKDYCELSQPVMDYLETDKGKNVANQLKQVLGKVRKEEKRIANRQYIPRVLKGSEK